MWNNCREGGQEKKVNVDLEPFIPISTSLCVTDSVEAFVTAVWLCVIGGSGGILCHPKRKHREALCEFSDSLEVREVGSKVRITSF